MVPCSALISSKLIDQRVLAPTKSAASSIVAIKASSHLKGEKISKSSFLMIVMAACWIKMARIRREDLSAWLSYLYFKFHCLERWAIADISIWGRVGCGGGFKKMCHSNIVIFYCFYFLMTKALAKPNQHLVKDKHLLEKLGRDQNSGPHFYRQTLALKGQRNWKGKSENKFNRFFVKNLIWFAM